MARPNVDPRDIERPFDIDELFFSTTDERGAILSGNATFARVAGFASVNELIGKPHNIIRHPDMPRAVFKLLWDTIAAKRPFCGFVKNLATDGCYYWVMALVVPDGEGYLSVRFKPSGNYFPIAQALYKEMLAIERETVQEGAGPREAIRRSSAHLLKRLAESGFADYPAFMHTALAAEMSARRSAIAALPVTKRFTLPADCDKSLAGTWTVAHEGEARLDTIFAQVEGLLDTIASLDRNSAYLSSLSDAVRLVSVNALTASYRLDQSGRGLGIITHELATVSEASTTVIGELSRHTAELTAALREAAAMIAGARLQVEMTLRFAEEVIEHGEADMRRMKSDIRTLQASLAGSVGALLDALPRVQKAILPLSRLRDGLVENLRLLSGVHVSGKIQASALANSGIILKLFEDIDSRLRNTQGEMQALSAGLSHLNEQVPALHRAGLAVQKTLLAGAA